MPTVLSLADQITYCILLLAGLAACFFGYRLFRFWLALAGLQTGFLLILWGGGHILKSPVLALVLAILAGILFAVLYAVLIRVGAFLAGAGTLVLLSILVMMLLPFGINVYIILAAILLGGLLGFFSVRPFLILFTAINGAFLAVDSIASLIIGTPVAKYPDNLAGLSDTALVLILISLMVLTILGSLVQFANDKQRGKVVKETAALTTTMESPKPAIPVNGDDSQAKAGPS